MRCVNTIVGLPLVLFAVALLSGCGGGGGSGGHSPSLHGTATAQLPTLTLSWHQVPLPAGVSLGNSTSFDVSPYQEGQAWVCAPQEASAYAFWTTTDAGVAWHQTGTLALPTTPYPINGCQLFLDPGSSQTLVAQFSYGGGEAGTLNGISFYSADDGATWQKFPGQAQAEAIATVGNNAFAILTPGEGANAPMSPWLVASTDGFHTMRRITLPGATAATSIFQLWSAPGSTSVVVGGDNAAWESDDGGTVWTSIRLPTQANDDFQLHFAIWASPSGPWTLCGASAPTPQSTPSPSAQAYATMRCSTTLGQTWQDRPLIVSTLNCTSCYKGNGPYTSSQPQICPATSATPGGTLLAFCPPPGTSTGTSTLGGAWHIFRLPATGTTWQDLGTPPSAMGSIIGATQTQVWFVATDGDNPTGIWVATLPPPA